MESTRLNRQARMAPDHLEDGQSEVVPDPGHVTASMSSAVEHLRRLAATAFTPGPVEIAGRDAADDAVAVGGTGQVATENLLDGPAPALPALTD
jgi:hypothetical protein